MQQLQLLVVLAKADPLKFRLIPGLTPLQHLLQQRPMTAGQTQVLLHPTTHLFKV
jgi:hypothetical protein